MKILSVDDNPQNRQIIERALKNDFEVVSDDGTTDIIELLNTHQPELILLDIMLGEKSGYDLCQQIRDDFDFEDTTVVFVSALNSPDDKLKAYGVGGDDYICKPVDIFELREKMVSLSKRLEHQKQLKAQADMASQAAFASMQQASELGELIKFFSESIEVTSPEQLFINIQSFFQSLGLNVCVEMRQNSRLQVFPENHTTLLEREILELGRHAKRIVPFGPNIMFNSAHCSLLIKKLPVDDEDLIGRLRDNFAIMLTIIDSRMMFFASEEARLTERKQAVESLQSLLKDDFEILKQMANNQEKKLIQFVDSLASTLEIKLAVLGLDEEQESEIHGMIDDIKESIHETADLSGVMDEKLTEIEACLKTIE